MTTTDSSQDRSRRASRRMLPIACPAALIVLTAWPLILAQIHRGRQASDQLRYHEVVVREFVRDWPAPDLTNYRSATTPGYHLAIATGAKLLGDARWKIQILASLFTIALVALLGWAIATRAPPLVALALTLPMATSLYVWPTAIWLLPDGAGWLGVVAILFLALDARQGPRTTILASVVLLLLVFVRQSHLWAAAILWTTAWLSSSSNENPPGAPAQARWRAELASIFSDLPQRLRATIPMLGVTLPAFVLVGVFAALWGGLTPPRFAGADAVQPDHTGLNLATPAYVLAVFGALAPFHVGFFWRSAHDLVRRRSPALAVAILIALAVSLIPATTFDMEAGRWSGFLWAVAQRAPEIAGHSSTAIVLLATLGTLAALAILHAQSVRSRWILLAAIIAFTAAQSTNSQAWQRYVEPFVLIWLVLACVRIEPDNAEPRRAFAATLRWLLPILLALGFAALTAASVFRSRAFPIEEYDRTVLPAIETGDEARLDASLERIADVFRESSKR